MDLILWRHAEAHDATEGQLDLDRVLTPRGVKQAARMAVWLDRQLPEGARVLCSPARRCEQTAKALARKHRLCAELAPGGSASELLGVAGWPISKTTVLIVGHQPTLGQAVAQLMGLQLSDCPVRKGAVWWLRSRERDGLTQTTIVTVQTPELL